MCERCEDLEEEVAYLKSELGLQEDAEAYRRLRAAMKAAAGNSGRFQAVGLVLALYHAKGRVLSRYQLLEVCPSPSGKEDRDATIINVWVHQVRKALGSGVIENVWGRGYRLTDLGRQVVSAVLGEERPVSGPELQDLSQRPDEDLRVLAAHVAGILAHRDGDGGVLTATTYRRIADRLTGQPRVAA